VSRGVTSAGTVRRFANAPLAVRPMANPQRNSYCIYCATWHFGFDLVRCEHCGARIFWWVPTCDLHLFRSGSPLKNL
jgi:hypothetical protein